MILRVDPDVTTLVDYHHSPARRAEHGGQGAGGHRNGGHGGDLVLPVPDGTVVLDERGEVIVDLVGAGTEVVVAQGGRGGLGNAALASAKRKAPGFALLGEPGEELPSPSSSRSSPTSAWWAIPAPASPASSPR